MKMCFQQNHYYNNLLLKNKDINKTKIIKIRKHTKTMLTTSLDSIKILKPKSQS